VITQPSLEAQMSTPVMTHSSPSSSTILMSQVSQGTLCSSNEPPPAAMTFSPSWSDPSGPGLRET